MLRVLLYGRSLFIAGLQASLDNVPGLELQDVEEQSDCLQQRISSWKPDVVIFQLDCLAQIPSLAMIKDYPNLLLIGMDTESDNLLVLSGRRQQVVNITDLVKVIQQERQFSYTPSA